MDLKEKRVRGGDAAFSVVSVSLRCACVFFFGLVNLFFLLVLVEGN